MASPGTRNTPDLAVRMQLAMTDEPLTVAELAEVAALSPVSVRRWLKAVRLMVFIEMFKVDSCGRSFIPAWRWGVGTDVKRPGCRQTPAERMRATRARRKQGGDAELWFLAGLAVLTVAPVAGFVWLLLVESQKPVIELKKDEWVCTRSEPRTWLMPTIVGKSTVLLPMTDSICVNYVRKDSP